MKVATFLIIAWRKDYIRNLSEQIPVLFYPIEQHSQPLYKINLRFPTQFTFAFAEVRIKDTLIPRTPASASHFDLPSQQSLENRTELERLLGRQIEVARADWRP